MAENEYSSDNYLEGEKDNDGGIITFSKGNQKPYLKFETKVREP